MSISPLSRYLNKPARICSICGSPIVALLASGAIRCPSCTPITEEPVGKLIAIESVRGRYTWQEAGDWDGDGVQGPGEAIASVAMSRYPPQRSSTSAAPLRPVERTREVFVSTRLGWFVIGDGSWVASILEVVNEDEIFRRLDELYFAWLYSRVLRLPSDHQPEAMSELLEIVIEGINAGVLPPTMIERENWPRNVPAWYEGPKPSSEFGGD